MDLEYLFSLSFVMMLSFGTLAIVTMIIQSCLGQDDDYLFDGVDNPNFDEEKGAIIRTYLGIGFILSMVSVIVLNCLVNS